MRIPLFLTASLFLGATASAQNFITGTSGQDVLYGKNGPVQDTINDGGGAGDVCYDSDNLQKSDGHHDWIDTLDGEFDTIFAGPEDTIFADDCDRIRIRDTKGKILFEGKYKVYRFLMDLIWDIEMWVLELAESWDQMWANLTDLWAHNVDTELDQAFEIAAEYLATLEENHNSPSDNEGEG